MRALSKDEIEKELLEEEMSTIHPPANGVSYNREELAANTWSGPSSARHPLTPAQLAELREKAPKNPSAYNAKAAADIAERQARQNAHDDKRRAELAQKKS
jgi:hypothetical protein